MNNRTTLIRCDREASDGTPDAPEVRCPNTTTADLMDGWLERNYGDFRKTYCPDCAKWHSDLCEPCCEWPGCDVHYRPFVAADVPKRRDLLEDGWALAYQDGDGNYCPEHAEQGEARNEAMRLARGEYADKLTQRLIDLASDDPHVQALIAEVREARVGPIEIRMALSTDRPSQEAS